MKSLNYIEKTFVCRSSHPTIVLCLLSIIRYHKGFIDSVYLESISKIIAGKTNLANLAKAAEAVGLKPIGKKTTPEQLKEIDNPAILGVTNNKGKNDCIVYYGYKDHYHIVGIPFFGIMQYSDDEMNAVWESQIVIYLELTDSFAFKKEIKRKQRKWFAVHFYTVLLSLAFCSLMFVLFLIFAGYTFYFFYFFMINQAMISLGLSFVCAFVFYACRQYGINVFKEKIEAINKNNDIGSNRFNKMYEFEYSIIPFIQYILLLLALSIMLVVSDFYFLLLVVGLSGIYLSIGFRYSRKIYKMYDSEEQNQRNRHSVFSLEMIEMKYISFIYTTFFPALIIGVFYTSLNYSLHIVFLSLFWMFCLFKLLLTIPKVRYFFFATQRLYYFNNYSDAHNISQK